MPPAAPPTRIDLHLRYRFERRLHDEGIATLRETVPILEAAPGVEVRFLVDHADGHAVIQLVLFDSDDVYRRERPVLDADPALRAIRDRLEACLAEPVRTETYRLATL